MMKLFRKLYLVVLMAAIALFAFVACDLQENGNGAVGGDSIEVSAEVGSTVNVTDYFKSGDHLANVTLQTPDGGRADFENGNIVLSRCGNWLLTLSDGSKVTFLVTDSVGPVIGFTGMKDIFYVGEEIELALSAMDAGDGAVALSSVRAFLGEKEISVSEGKFTPSEKGSYRIVCTAADTKGNETTQDYTLKVMNPTPYGDFSVGLTNIQIDGAVRVEKEYVDGDDYSYLVNSVAEQGWADISLQGKNLTPYSKYNLTVEVTASEVEGDFAFAVYPSTKTKDHLAVVFEGDHTISFEVCTDGKGDFDVSYYAWTTGVARVLWKSVSATFAETYSASDEPYVFYDSVLDGVTHSFTMNAGASSPDFKNVVSDDGFTTINFGHYGYATMDISGTGLLPEKEYTFTLQYSAKNVTDANFAFIVYSNSDLTDPVMLGWKAKNTVTYTVTTDASGCYHVAFNNFTLISNGLQLTWEAIYSAVEDKGSIYGSGITFANGNASSAGTEQWIGGENAGYTRWKAYFDGSKKGSLVIGASADAGLEANTEYRVTVTAISDRAVGYIVYASAYAGEQVIGDSEGTLTFTVTTDGNGCFEMNIETYHNGCTWVDFTGLTVAKYVEPKGSIYGSGITFGNGNASSAGTEQWTDGENAGYTRWKAYFDGSKKGSLVIGASADAGLEANTEYRVTVTAISDCAVGYIVYASAYAGEQVIGDSEGTLTFTVTTDGNGCFEMNIETYHNGCTWVDFTGLTVVAVQD